MSYRLSHLGASSLVALLVATTATPAAAQGARLDFGADSSLYVTFGGQVRLRAEGWSGFGFQGPAPVGPHYRDAFGLSRLLGHAELHVRQSVTVYLEAKSSLVTNRVLPGRARAIDKDVLDVQQAYVDGGTALGSWRASARVGRADLLFGRERLVSPLDWVNTRRTFQGASVTMTGHAMRLEAFWAHPVLVRREKPNIGDSTHVLYGLYATRAWPDRAMTTDAYWLRSESRAAAFNGTAGYERRNTLGVRVARRAPEGGGLDFDVEAATQFGSIGAQDVGATMLGSEAGWTLSRRGAPRVYVGLDYASGDKKSGGSVGTFNQLYPLGHAYLGYLDVVGRQNVVDLRGGVTLHPTEPTSLRLDVHNFWRASASDALYDAGGAVLRAAGTSNANRIGTEFDLTARMPVYGGRVWMQGGISRFFAGKFLQETGQSHDIDWIYVQASLNF